ncbi:hypothetical protein [Enterobacter asburiae]|uniref:hypothetical protein n=1 Tax=Enterobacter asburiae TaxID=61645 RepID=UPI003D6E0118
MSTITKEFTKEQLQQIIETDHVQCGEASSLARIALASLEAEPVCVIDQSNLDYLKSGSDADVWPASITEMGDVLLYRSAPPAPVSVPAAMEMDDDFDSAFEHGKAVGWNACRAAMLQGAEPVKTANKLPDDFDFDRFNDVTWLDAVASNPHMHSLTTSTIAMVALELNKRLEAGNSPVIPDGWVMVPEDPTHEMLEAGDEQFGTYDVYRRMIEAAPKLE